MNVRQPLPFDYPFAAPPPPGTTIEVAPNICWLRMPLPFALDHINLWLLADGAECVAVDCGYGDAPTRALWEQHFVGTLQGGKLTRIVATHYHPDHLGNAQWLAQRFGASVSMTLGEFLTAQAFTRLPGDGAGPVPVELLRAHGLDATQAAALSARGNGYRRAVPELPAHFDRIVGGDTLQLAGISWRVIPGYGHSPEHAALYATERAVLIAGDMLLPRISTNVSITATDPDGDPLARFLDSLTPLAALPDNTLVLPSHGLPFRGAALRVAQLRAHHAQRLAELAAHIDAAAEPVAAADVLQLLFNRTLDLQQLTFAMGEAVAHLNHLWRSGRIARDIAGDGRIHFRKPA